VCDRPNSSMLKCVILPHKPVNPEKVGSETVVLSAIARGLLKLKEKENVVALEPS
jgi:hypothetical protein